MTEPERPPRKGARQRPSASGSEPRRLEPRALEAIVADRGELTKGARFYQASGLRHLARFQQRLFAEATGAGARQYRVRVDLADQDDKVQGRCTCMAARSRPFCKHASALLWAWLSEPEAFVASERAPEELTGRRRSIQKGKRSAAELMRDGVEQVDTLVRELGVVGVASISGERVAELGRAGEMLREHKLRRLSARCLDLAAMLEGAPEQPIDELAYTALLADMLLTAGRLRRHLGGEPLEDRYVEELVGKTWRKSERPPIAGLDLCEYSYSQRTTSDAYEIRESRFFDLAGGEHYSEKQILPRFLARRTREKRSYRGTLLRGAGGTLYPGFAPRRLELGVRGSEVALASEDLERLLTAALPDVAAAMERFRQHRRDPFAPDRLPVALRAGSLLASGQRLQICDPGGATLYLPPGDELAQELGAMLARGPLCALLGDVYADVILPALSPLAAVVRGSERLELWPLAAATAAAAGSASPRAPARWAEVARAAGLSRVAISLGEVREELAQLFVAGLAGLDQRALDPLAARLSDLGLGAACALLERLRAATDPGARVPEFVKLFHLLEVALLRLASAGSAERDALVPVPGWHGVLAPRPTAALSIGQVWELERSGQLSEFEAALHLRARVDALPDPDLTGDLALWASGGAAPHIAAALAARGEAVARAGAARAVELCQRGAEVGRTAALAALTVLAELAPDPEPFAGALVAAAQAARALPDGSALAGLLLDGLARLRPGGELGKLVDLRRQLLAAELPGALADLARSADKDERVAAAYLLGACGARLAIPGLRTAFRRDPSRDVRDRAALSLAQLGDSALLPALLAALEGEDERGARLALHAIGWLGDARALPVLLAAAERGVKPVLVAEALGRAPALVIEPLLDRFEENPALARRKGLVSAAAGVSPERAHAALARRIAGAPPAALPERASAYLAVAAAAGVTAPTAALLVARLERTDGAAAVRACRAARRLLE